jgi:hypothetical protein
MSDRSGSGEESVHEKKNLLDLAVWLSLLVLAVQYSVNTVGARFFEWFLVGPLKRTEEDARSGANNVIRAIQLVVVVALIGAAVLGAVGWFGE